MTTTSLPACGSCDAQIPTRLVSRQLDADHFLLAPEVDLDALRAHLLSAHPVLVRWSAGPRLRVAS